MITPAPILPLAQQQLWPCLGAISQLGFVLYGGTAIALRLGHRQSVDFDFFTERSISHAELERQIPFLARSQVIQQALDTLTVLVPMSAGEVKVSFFGGLRFGRVGTPEWTDDGVLQVASVDDLLATKLKVMLDRVEARDYVDIAALIDGHASLARGLGSARALFGEALQSAEPLRALTWFEGGDLDTLPDAARKILVQAASSVADVEDVDIVSPELGV